MLRAWHLAVAYALAISPVSPLEVQSADAALLVIPRSSSVATELTVEGGNLSPRIANVLPGSFKLLTVVTQAATVLVVNRPDAALLPSSGDPLRGQIGNNTNTIGASMATAAAVNRGEITCVPI